MGGTVLNYGSKELYLEAYKAGWEKGLKEWRIDLVTRKYQRGESIEKIADDLLPDSYLRPDSCHRSGSGHRLRALHAPCDGDDRNFGYQG